MKVFRKMKSKKKHVQNDQLDKEIIACLEQLNIPPQAREGVLKLPEAQKQMMLEQYRTKLETADTKPKASGKEWSDKFKDPKVDWKVLKQFEVITKDSDAKFAIEFIQELGLKRLCRVSRENTDSSFDSQILYIFKAIIDTSQNIIKDIINDDVTVQTIAAKVDSTDHRVRELSIKLLVTLVIVEDDELSWIASTKIMAALLDSARLRGYRNRWKCVLSHLSINELSGTASFEYDNYALMLINFIISALETLEERTDERRLLNSLKFSQSLENLAAEIDDTLRAMESTNSLSLSRHTSNNARLEASVGSMSSAELSSSVGSMTQPGLPKRMTTIRPRRLSGHQSQLHQFQYCQSVLTQITAYKNLREEDLHELREEGILDDENDLSSPNGLFKVVHDQALQDGYINEFTAILKNLITIPASGDLIWGNINKVIQSACAPIQKKYVNNTSGDGDDEKKTTYLSFKELQHLLKVQATDEEKQKDIEAKHNETQLKLNEERQKVGNLEKQVQSLQTKLTQQFQTLQTQTEALEKQYDEVQALHQRINQLQTASPAPATWSGGGGGGLPAPVSPQVAGGLPPLNGGGGGGGLPRPALSPTAPQGGGGLPRFNGGGGGGLPAPSATPEPPLNGGNAVIGLPPPNPMGGLPPPAPIPGGGSGLPPPAIATSPIAEDTYATYRKMIKMKIPKRSICNKMKQAGIAQDIIQKYEITGELPPIPAGVAQAAAAPAVITPAPLPTPVAVPDELDKYRKMIKMNIPKQAIANKMKQGGVEHDIIQKYELTGELPPSGGAPPPLLVPPPLPNGGSVGGGGLTKEEEVKLAKYTRMKKMKLPENSIRNRMIQDGLEKSLVEKFFGGGSAAPSAKLPKVKPKPKWPENLKRKTEIKPGRKMKNLQWTTVDPFTVEKSIWREVDDSKIKFNPKDLEDMFGQKVIARKAPKSGGRKKKEAVEQIHILDGKRSYNIEIFLGRLKMDPFTVKDLLLDMNEKRFNAEKVAKLKNFVPTPEEANLFDDLETADVKLLAKPEKFFYTIKNIDKNLPQRLEVWAFKMNFDKIYATENDKVVALCDAHQCIKTSKSLRELFSTILAFGNYMNGGTRKGCAHGFKLKSLSQLTRSRSTNNKVTLMEYLYLYLLKSNAKLLEFTEEWKPLETAISVDIPTLRAAIAQIGAKLNIIDKRCKAAETNSIAGDKFAEIMKPFHSTACTQFESLKSKHDGIMKDMCDLALFLNEKNDRTGQFLKTLNEFRKQFIFTAKQCKERQKREAEKKKREQWKLNKKQKAANKHAKTTKKQGLPVPIMENDALSDDIKEAPTQNKVGLPPPPPPSTPNHPDQKMFSSNPRGADQLLAALMQSDSSAMMNKLKARRKKMSVTHNAMR